MTPETPAAGREAEIIPGECGYELREWSCREGGYLWDTDGDGYDLSDCSYPCPACNTKAFLEDAVEHAPGWEMHQWVYTSGAERFRRAVEIACEANPSLAGQILSERGPVACLDWRWAGYPDTHDTITVIENLASSPTSLVGGG